VGAEFPPPVGAAVAVVDVLTVGDDDGSVGVTGVAVGLKVVGFTGEEVTVGDVVGVESVPSQLPHVLLHWLFQYESEHQFG
jgi:hypothetical protein